MPTTKQQVQHVLDQLPDDCTIDDVQYHLDVMQQVESGLAAIDRGDTIPHEEVNRRLAKWLST
jgi:predicted transcriptional regulator